MPSERRTVDIHGYAFRAIREAKGLKVAVLADRLECDRSYLTKIELGHSRRVSVAFYNALLRELMIDDFRALLATAPERDEAVA